MTLVNTTEMVKKKKLTTVCIFFIELTRNSGITSWPYPIELGALIHA